MKRTVKPPDIRLDKYQKNQYNQIYLNIRGSLMNCCASPGNDQACCKVESVVRVDERGQMVLPKDLREKANIKAGDKLAVVSWGQNDGVRCLVLVKVDDLSNLVKQMLGPAFKEMSK
jgi:AbrB family looped-hinge helix DNA binding protein